MRNETETQDEIDVTSLLADLKVMREDRCSGCGAAVCGHEALMSLTMGFKGSPRCWQCLAAALAHEKESLRDRLFALITHRDCYNQGWVWANREEGLEPEQLPDCLWPGLAVAGSKEESPFSGTRSENPAVDPDPHCSAEWDAGGMGCGDLVLELRIRLQSLEPGQILKVLATDSGAIEDLPAWCRMTGNSLVASRHPVYLIRKKAA
jgi:tRNA 2-thiouridine synthesizing protein A